MIDDEQLDSVGFEEDDNAVLGVWLETQKNKQDGIPLANLVDKVREVAGLMPILKKVFKKQIDLELGVENFMATCRDEFLYQDQQTVWFSEFRRDITGMVQDFLKDCETRVNDRLAICPTEDSVAKRLKIKATSADYGELVREFRQLQRDLNPLIEKGHTLYRFIH